ncbi:MAG: DM13 domain-containing protein [Acidimicrobiales bacterium]
MGARPRPRRRRTAIALAALLATAVLAGCGSSGDSGEEVGSGSGTSAPAASTTSSTAPKERSAPRWETVTTLEGSGPTRTDAFEILPDAIQWRARFECAAGTLKVTSVPPPRRGTPLIDSACPKKGEGFSIVSGSVRMNVEATGTWKLIVDQQVDLPLREPPLEEMASAPVLGQGDFFNVEMEGKGTARLYHLADGRNVLRFENFQVSNNTDLFVWLSEAPNPRTSADAVSANKVVLGNLRSTVGSQNYVLPADLAPEKVKSIVIWCAPVSVAYIAVVLGRPS